jgi:DNA-binding response OmpR family regulator
VAGETPSSDVITRHRILIIEDEESMRLLLAQIMTKDLDAEVQLAGTCEQGLRLAGTYVYDAILLDLLMPGIGGFAVLKELRADSRNTATPIIVVTVVSDKASQDSCLAAGASAYHVKPVRRAELVETVKAQLHARRRKPSKE